MSLSTVAITNIDIKVWTRKIELPQGNLLRYSTKTEITRQRLFKLTYFKYDQIRDEITRMEHVYYNKSTGRNVMNVDDIEDFANL